MTTRRTMVMGPASRTLRKEIPSSRLVLRSAKTHRQLRSDEESAVRVTSVTNSEPNATGSTRAPIALVGFPPFSDASPQACRLD